VIRPGVVLSASIAAALLLVSGCGPSSSAEPVTTVPVKGKVTYKGQPLVRGTIRFQPDGAGREASAEIQADGTYALSTAKEGDGAVPGNHRVTVVGGTGPSAGSKVPGKFASAGSSKLEVEVSAGKTDYPVDLR